MKPFIITTIFMWFISLSCAQPNLEESENKWGRLKEDYFHSLLYLPPGSHITICGDHASKNFHRTPIKLVNKTLFGSTESIEHVDLFEEIRVGLIEWFSAVLRPTNQSSGIYINTAERCDQVDGTRSTKIQIGNFLDPVAQPGNIAGGSLRKEANGRDFIGRFSVGDLFVTLTKHGVKFVVRHELGHMFKLCEQYSVPNGDIAHGLNCDPRWRSEKPTYSTMNAYSGMNIPLTSHDQLSVRLLACTEKDQDPWLTSSVVTRFFSDRYHDLAPDFLSNINLHQEGSFDFKTELLRLKNNGIHINNACQAHLCAQGGCGTSYTPGSGEPTVWGQPTNPRKRTEADCAYLKKPDERQYANINWKCELYSDKTIPNCGGSLSAATQPTGYPLNDALYYCDNAGTRLMTRCAFGCLVASPGKSDFCCNPFTQNCQGSGSNPGFEGHPLLSSTSEANSNSVLNCLNGR